MSKIALSGNASGTGTLTIAAPNTSTDRTLTLPDATGTVQVSGNPISGTTGTFSGTISVGSTIGVGGATPAASGAGITFPASQSASSDGNTLDDYEEGTWTPAMSGSFTYSSRSGRYTKIGNVVTITGAVNWSANASAAVQLAVSGFPFAVGDVRVAGSIGYTAGVDNSGGKQLIVTTSSPSTSFDYWSLNDNGAPNTVGADAASATGELQFTFVYRTS